MRATDRLVFVASADADHLGVVLYQCRGGIDGRGLANAWPNHRGIGHRRPTAERSARLAPLTLLYLRLDEKDIGKSARRDGHNHAAQNGSLAPRPARAMDG